MRCARTVMATSIWRPARELVDDARAAAARGDTALACRLGFAATMHATTRGDDNPKYALTEKEQEEAMLVWTPLLGKCDFKAISSRVNEEIASSHDRPATGFGACGVARLAAEQRDQTPFPEPTSGGVPLVMGTRVRVDGLCSRSDLNGRAATVLSYDPKKDRYAVRMDGPSDEHVRVSSNRMVEIAASTATAPSPAALLEAAASGRLSQLMKMVQNGAAPNGTAQGRGGRPLSAAAAAGHLKCVKALLASRADPNLGNMYGSTALHDASYNGKVDVVQHLLSIGANVDPRDANGSTPLIAACAAGQVGVAKVLVDGGAEVTPQAFGANSTGVHSNQAEIARLLEAGNRARTRPDWAARENAPPQVPPRASSRAPPRAPDAAGSNRRCAACFQTVPCAGYSNTQWRKFGDAARCKACIEGRQAEPSLAQQPPAPPAKPFAPDDPRAKGMRSGDKVRAHGLMSRPELNGCTGRLIGALDATTGRFPVRLGSSDVKIKPANLDLVDFARDDTEVDFVRPGGGLESKDVYWCRTNGFEQVGASLWAGEWWEELNAAAQERLLASSANRGHHSTGWAEALRSMSDDEDEDVNPMLRGRGSRGFSADEVEELALQGIKPWDPEARAAVQMLFPGKYGYDDDYYDDDHYGSDDDYYDDDY